MKEILYVCKGFQNYLFYPTEANILLECQLKLEPIVLFSFNVFIGHSLLQPAGTGYLGYHNVRYHMNDISDNFEP